MARRASKKRDAGPQSNFDMLFLQLMMIMMAFFILLSALSIIIEEKRLKALDSIAGAFSLMPTGANLTQGEGASMPSRELGAETAATYRTAKSLTNVAKLLGMNDAIEVLPLDKSTVRVRMRELILFAPGQTKLSDRAIELIARIAEIMQQPEIQEITIEGHTDKTPVRGEGAMGNWELSAARAMQIFLEFARHDIPKSKLVAAGMGDTQPLPTSETKGDDSLNRRVELMIKFRPTTSKDAQMISTGSRTPSSAVSKQGD